MKTLKIYLIFFLVIFSILSCGQGSDSVSTQLNFSRKFNIEGKIVLDDFVRIQRLHALDTLLLAVLTEDDHYFEIFDSNTHESLGKFGPKGRGPGELIGPVRYCNYVFEHGAYKLWFYDINSHELFKVNVTASLVAEKTIVENKVYLGRKANFEKAFELSHDRLIGSMSNQDVRMGRLRIFDPQKQDIIKTVEAFPEIEPLSDDITYLFYKHNFLYVGNIDIRPDNKLIASALNKMNRIDIFDDSGALVNSIIEGPEIQKSVINEYLLSEDVSSTNIRTHYVDIQASQEFIFGLYYGNFFKDYNKEQPITLRVFDWSGSPLASITIPDYLETFTIDETNWILYGVKSSTDGSVLRYDLKNIINEL